MKKTQKKRKGKEPYRRRKGEKGKRIRLEKRQRHSRFPVGQKHLATAGKTTDNASPETTVDIDQ